MRVGGKEEEEEAKRRELLLPAGKTQMKSFFMSASQGSGHQHLYTLNVKRFFFFFG